MNQQTHVHAWSAREGARRCRHAPDYGCKKFNIRSSHEQFNFFLRATRSPTHRARSRVGGERSGRRGSWQLHRSQSRFGPGGRGRPPGSQSQERLGHRVRPDEPGLGFGQHNRRGDALRRQRECNSTGRNYSRRRADRHNVQPLGERLSDQLWLTCHFRTATFLWATENGNIAAWRLACGSTAVTIPTTATPNGVYKGIAIAGDGAMDFRLFAADLFNGKIRCSTTISCRRLLQAASWIEPSARLCPFPAS